MAKKRKSRYQPPRRPNLTPWWAVAILIMLAGITLLLVGYAMSM